MNRGQPPAAKEDEKKQQFLGMWGISSELVNHFIRLTSPVYTKEEVDDLKDLYDRIANANTTHVKQLLSAIDQFLCATTMESYFKNLRDISIEHHEYDPVAVLNKMAEELLAINKTSKQLIEKGQNADAVVLTAAFHYGVDVIRRRLDGLKELHDDVHKTFLQTGNELKKILEAKDKAASRKSP